MTSQSGDRDHHGHITKSGNSELRSMLIEAAHHASKPKHPLHSMFARICAKKGYKIAVTAVAHRLLRIMWAMLKNQTDFDVSKLGLEEGPFVTTKVTHYRLRKRAKQRLSLPSSNHHERRRLRRRNAVLPGRADDPVPFIGDLAWRTEKWGIDPE